MVKILDLVHGWSMISITARLLLSALIGMLIGIDREYKKRGAGIRTHVLVCLGSALVMVTSQYIFITFPGAKADINRIGAQVVSGVGFLGAGTIIMTRENQVKGLTTAAGLWASACVGLAIGIGFIEGACIVTILIIFTLKCMSILDARIRRKSTHFELYIELVSNKALGQIINTMREMKIRYYDLNIYKGKLKGEGPSVNLIINAPDTPTKDNFIQFLSLSHEIKYYEIL